MRIAVVQHRYRPAPAQDLEALVMASAQAAAHGSELVVLPDVAPLHEGPLSEELYRRLEDEVPGPVIITTHLDEEEPGSLFSHEAEGMGRWMMLVGDACMDVDVLSEAARMQAGLLVMAPRSESELQAQAVLELAVGLSTSLASLVVVVEPDGAELGEPGHGGSAIIHLGQVVTEAIGGDDLLLADVETPLGPPPMAAALPDVPPVLLQRVAAHRGRKVDVGYPADLG